MLNTVRFIFKRKYSSLYKGLLRKEVLHQPVMVNEVLDNLYPQKGDVILDMTFGAGGHTRAILDKCEHCRVIALDRDPIAHEMAVEMATQTCGRVIPVLGRFSELEELFGKYGITSINGAIIDAGCSSMQFDTPDRGFSVVRDGPLDMRMDGNRYPTQASAADVVNRLSAEDLAEILERYGEEKYAKKIARYIVHHRKMEGPIRRTRELADIIASAFDPRGTFVRKDALNRQSHIAIKTFMAIRIFVNDELNELYAGLKTVEKHTTLGGRLVAITFHSLEDRVVKRVLSGTDIHKPFGMTISQQAKDESSAPNDVEKKWMVLRKKVVLPQFDEVEENTRSRSAKLRSATRI